MSARQKHTPGPWHACAGAPGRGMTAVCDYADGVGPYRMVADCGAGDRPLAEAEANARLVAAAPYFAEVAREALFILQSVAAADPSWTEAAAVRDRLSTLLAREEAGR